MNDFVSIKLFKSLTDISTYFKEDKILIDFVKQHNINLIPFLNCVINKDSIVYIDNKELEIDNIKVYRIKIKEFNEILYIQSEDFRRISWLTKVVIV